MHAGKACELNLETCRSFGINKLYQMFPVAALAQQCNEFWIIPPYKSTFQGCLDCTALFRLCHSISMGLRPGLLIGNSRILTFFFLSHYFVRFGSSCCCITQPLLSLRSSTALGPFAPAGCKNKLGVSPALGLVTSRLKINIYTRYTI